MFILGDGMSMGDEVMFALIIWLGSIILFIIHFFLCFIRRSRLVIYSFICIWTPLIFIIFGVPKLKEMERVRIASVERVRIASVVCQMHASVMDELEAKSQFTINEKIIFSDDKILYEAEHGSKLADHFIDDFIHAPNIKLLEFVNNVYRTGNELSFKAKKLYNSNGEFDRHSPIFFIEKTTSRYTLKAKILYQTINEVDVETTHWQLIDNRNNKSIAEWKDNSMRQYISSDCNAPKYTKIPSKFPKLIKFIG